MVNQDYPSSSAPLPAQKSKLLADLSKRGIPEILNATINGVPLVSRNYHNTATVLHYHTKDSGQATYSRNMTGSRYNKPYVRYRFDNPIPEYHKDGSPVLDAYGNQRTQRYKTPYKAGTLPYISALLFYFPNLFGKDFEGIDTLYLSEGEFKAIVACKYGLETIGFSGINNVAKAIKKNPKDKESPTIDATFRPELLAILKMLKVKRIVLIHDKDAMDNTMFGISNVWRAKYSFFPAVRNVLFACKKLGIKLTYAYGLTDYAKGLDDLINTGATHEERQAIADQCKLELSNENITNKERKYFAVYKVTDKTINSIIRPLFANSTAKLIRDKELITVKQFIGEAYPKFEAIVKAIEQGKDFALDAPTGIGKNWILYYLVKLFPNKRFFFLYPTNLSNEAQKNENEQAHDLAILKIDQTTDKEIKKDLRFHLLDSDVCNLCYHSYNLIDGAPTPNDVIILDEVHKIPICWTIAPKEQLSKILNSDAQKIHVSGTHFDSYIQALGLDVIKYERVKNPAINIKCVELISEAKVKGKKRRNKKAIKKLKAAIESGNVKAKKLAQYDGIIISRQTITELKANLSKAIKDGSPVEAIKSIKNELKQAKAVHKQTKKANSIGRLQHQLDKLNRAKSQATDKNKENDISAQIRKVQATAHGLTAKDAYLKEIKKIESKKSKLRALEYKRNKEFLYSTGEQTQLYKLAALNLMDSIDQSEAPKLHFMFINNKESIDYLAKQAIDKGFDIEKVYSDPKIKNSLIWEQLTNGKKEIRQLDLFKDKNSGLLDQITIRDKHKIIFCTSVAYESINIKNTNVGTFSILGECWTENVRQAIARLRKVKALDVNYFMVSDGDKDSFFADFKTHHNKWLKDYDTAINKLESFDKKEVLYRANNDKEIIPCNVAYTLDTFNDFDKLKCVAKYEFNRAMKMNNAQRFTILSEHYETSVYKIDVSKVCTLNTELTAQQQEELETQAQQQEELEDIAAVEIKAEKVKTKEKAKELLNTNFNNCIAFLLFATNVKYDENKRNQITNIIGKGFNKLAPDYLECYNELANLGQYDRQKFIEYTSNVLRLQPYLKINQCIEIAFSPKYKYVSGQLSVIERNTNKSAKSAVIALYFDSIDQIYKEVAKIEKSKRRALKKAKIKARSNNDSKRIDKALNKVSYFDAKELKQVYDIVYQDLENKPSMTEFRTLIKSLFLYEEPRSNKSRKINLITKVSLSKFKAYHSPPPSMGGIDLGKLAA